MANTPGRFGGIFKTKVVLVNFEEDLEIEVDLYGPNGFVDQDTILLRENTHHIYNNFLDDIFDYRGAGAVEFSASGPFFVSAEVYIRSENGKYTTVVSNQPLPLVPYSSWASSIGGVTVDGSNRTNLGVFNSSNRSQTVTARVYYRGDEPDQVITFDMRPKSWAQKTVTARGRNGQIVWVTPREAYLWVVGVDNDSNDGTLAVPIHRQ